MSDHRPPQPGSSYNPNIPNIYMPRLSNTYNLGASQTSFQASPYGPNTSIGTAPVTPAPDANAYSFYSNAQGVTASDGGGGNRNPSGHTDQANSLAPPPPPHSPISIPTNGSYHSRPSTLATTISTHHSNCTYIQSEPHDLRYTVNDQYSQPEKSGRVDQVTSDLEDGEVDDDEIETSNLSKVNEMGLNFSRSSAQAPDDAVNTTTGARVNGHTNSTYESSPGVADGQPSPSNDQLPIPQRPTQPREAGENVNIPSRRSVTPSLDNTSNPVSAANGATDALRKREEAKQALIDLHSHGLDFSQIVEQGMNPDILRTLYAELGIEVSSTVTPQLQQNSQDGAIAQVDRTTKAAHTVSKEQPQDNKLASSKARGASHVDGQTDNLQSNSGINTSSKDEQKSAASPIANIAPKKPTGTGLLAKASVTKTTDNKPMDRKDYIARMLAAKAAKPTSNSNTTFLLPKAATDKVPVVASQVPSPITTETSSVPVAPLVVQQPNQVGQTQALDVSLQSKKHEADADSKRKAQTELARQKIEALKNRQGIRKATGTDSPHTSQIAASRANPPLPVVIPAVAPRPSFSSHQGSYFSPISQKTPFNIPGLFMTTDLSQPVKPSEKDPSLSDAAPIPLRPSQQPSPNPAAAPSIKQSFETSNEGVLADHATKAPVNRKRQRAADFLDSPSTRVKKPLGHQADPSVVIDISDEEMADTSEVESLDIGANSVRVNAFKKAQLNENTNGKLNPTKDLPPLSDISSQRRTSAKTPPIAPTPTQAKGLKTKEMEIELMNRKIAELEQRISAKKIVSRAHTPTTSGNTTVSPLPLEPSDNTEDTSKAQSKDPIESSERTASYSVEAQQPPQVINETADTITTEQKLHKIELAKAEAERSLAADVAQLSEDRQTLQEEILPTVQKVTKSPPGNNTYSAETTASAEPQGFQEHRLDFEQQSRTHNQEVASLQEPGSIARAENESRQQDTRHIPSQTPAKANAVGERRRMRRMAIESGLPVLDASVEYTRKKLDSLRREIEDLELEVQKGIEGRRALVDELLSLSQSTETAEPTDEQKILDASKPMTQSIIRADAKAVIVTSPSSKVGDNPSPSVPLQLHNQEASSSTQASTTSPHDSIQTLTSLPPAAEQHLPDAEFEEDIMDISRSDVDEGEASDYSPKPPHTKSEHKAGANDDEENYEPPVEVSVLEQQRSHTDQAPSNEEVRNDTTNTALDLPLTNGHKVQESQSFLESTEATDPQTEEPSSQPHSPLVDASDPDDYEPPEPAPLALGPALPVQAPIVNSESSFSPRSVDVSDEVALFYPDSQSEVEHVKANAETARPNPEKEPDPTRRLQQFVPYESPLKQFRSFRNHPEYLNEVSCGFRSLTYSHAIKPEIPICRYELHGTCNDASCQSQHLESVGLSDEKILVDLGSTPERSDISVIDATAFTDGLKKLVQDIRSRKVKDVNLVASEITAYRRRFLGDFRILSL